VQCWAAESHRVASKSRPWSPSNPVELLCLALQLAPACYRHFELRAAQLHSKLQLEADKDGEMSRHQQRIGQARRGAVKDFHSAAKLAAAMRRWGAEDLLVRLSANLRSIIVGRATDADDDAINVQRRRL